MRIHKDVGCRLVERNVNRVESHGSGQKSEFLTGLQHVHKNDTCT